MAAPKIKVFHLDDDPKQTKLFQILLEDEPDMVYAGACHNSAELLAALEKANADALVMDLRVDAGDAIETIRDTRKAFPKLAIVIFSGYDEPDVLALARAAGANGRVTKGDDMSKLWETIRRVLAERPAP